MIHRWRRFHRTILAVPGARANFAVLVLEIGSLWDVRDGRSWVFEGLLGPIQALVSDVVGDVGREEIVDGEAGLDALADVGGGDFDERGVQNGHSSRQFVTCFGQSLMLFRIVLPFASKRPPQNCDLYELN